MTVNSIFMCIISYGNDTSFDHFHSCNSENDGFVNNTILHQTVYYNGVNT